jgi:hypothetical protein
LLGPYGFYAKEVKFYTDLSDVIRPYLKVPKLLFGVIDPAPAAWKFCLIMADLSEFGAAAGDDCVGYSALLSLAQAPPTPPHPLTNKAEASEGCFGLVLHMILPVDG